MKIINIFVFMLIFFCNNKIIEFYGNFYHANPLLYDSDKIISSKYKKYTAFDIWKRDSDRINLIKSKGYDVLIVW